MTSVHRKQFRAIETLLPGQVSYLKKRAECSERDLLKTNISEGCFDHLVLILSTDTRKAQVEALILTSFGGKSIEERHPHSRRIRLLHLPIDPGPKHPDNGILLELEGDVRLPKKTYVKTESPYTIPWSMLRPYRCDSPRGKVVELKPQSFAQLLQYMDAGFSAEQERLPETINAVHAGHQGHEDVQGQGTSGPTSVLQLTLGGFLVMVVIYIILAYLQPLFYKALDFVV